MNDLTKMLFDYFKDNDIDPNKVANLIEDAKINVLDEMFGEEGEWVLKKLGSVESFDKEKIFHSIAQTSDSAGAKMNTSDVNIIVEDVLKKMKSIKRNVYPNQHPNPSDNIHNSRTYFLYNIDAPFFHRFL